MNTEESFCAKFTTSAQVARCLYAILYVIVGTFLMLIISPALGVGLSTFCSSSGLEKLIVGYSIFIMGSVLIFVGLYQMRHFSSKRMWLMRLFYALFAGCYLLGCFLGMIPLLGGLLQGIVHVVAFILQLVALIFLYTSDTFKTKGYFALTLWLLLALFSIVTSVLRWVQIFGVVDLVQMIVYSGLYLLIAVLLFSSIVDKQKVVLKLKGAYPFILFSLLSVVLFFKLLAFGAGQNLLMVIGGFSTLAFWVLYTLLAIVLKGRMRVAMLLLLINESFPIITMTFMLGTTIQLSVTHVLTFAALLLLFFAKYKEEDFKQAVKSLLFIEAFLSVIFLLEYVVKLSPQGSVPFYSLTWSLRFIATVLAVFAWRKLGFSFLKRQP